ncbi:hypothetical protein [Paenibacillus methanolicus]|uniref:Uncharacterized protein n=1 Tax=Paenibacillus methanolicus TaxID=582686 RepID=A0A5S5CEL5_9BACL|nr:hypothetical protein [Paenibacillus methanolicus]TYP77794.1 hypothetical protein BCM02_102359 [Paenibacillus methanolicus]
MRMTGFIIGTITGMAAAAYLSKKRPGMVAWAGAATGDIISSVKGKAIGAVMNRKFGQSQSVQPTSASSAGTANSAESWGQIEMLVNSDPELKRQAEEIASETPTTH